MRAHPQPICVSWSPIYPLLPTSPTPLGLQACPGAYEPGVRYVTVAGRYIQGSELTGKEGTWQQRVVGAGYQQVCFYCGWLVVGAGWVCL